MRAWGRWAKAGASGIIRWAGPWSGRGGVPPQDYPVRFLAHLTECGSAMWPIKTILRRHCVGGAFVALALGLVLSANRPAGAARPEVPLRPRVLLIVFDPIIEVEGGTPRRLSELCGHQAPDAAIDAYIRDLRECSGGFVQYRVVERRVVDGFPLQKGGFQYSDEQYLECLRTGRGWHVPERADYAALVRDFGLVRRIDRREIDEVWISAMPHVGLYESVMAGRSAYFCNAPPLVEVDTDRSLVFMGFNYQSGQGEMLDSFGHRVESIMRKVYGPADPSDPDPWYQFTRCERTAPGRAACGTLHLAPNSTRDSDWGNAVPVESTADDWANFPHLTGKTRKVSCVEWGNGDMRAHHKWWLAHLPRASGRGPDNRQANWWKYVVDFNRYDESR